MGDKSEDLAWRRQQSVSGGGAQRMDALRSAGRGTARERIDALLDPDSFIEIDALVSHRNREGHMHMHPQAGALHTCPVSSFTWQAKIGRSTYLVNTGK